LAEAYKRHYQKIKPSKQCGLNPESVIKTHIKIVFLLPVLLVTLGLLLAGRASAQTFTNLHSFTAVNNYGDNGDGCYPLSTLVLSGNTLYGTASAGGTNVNDYSQGGTVFAVHTDGSGFANLHSFAGGTNDGGYPRAGLTLSGNTLYGTTYNGGLANHFVQGDGTVFGVATDGSGFTILHEFVFYTDGAWPFAGLILSGNTLYGTTPGGGTNNGGGTVFALTTDGKVFTVLHTFTNSPDGDFPEAGLILSGNTLYGTTFYGGTYNGGTVFAINTDGTGYTNLHSLNIYTASDGTSPAGGLVISGNTLYGTTSNNGRGGQGTVFAVNTNGSDFTVLHSFSGDDGQNSIAGLVLSGKTLYGTTMGNGNSYSDNGTVFAINTDGTGFTTLYSFTRPTGSSFTNSDGWSPQAGLVLSGNTVYGTAIQGGIYGNGNGDGGGGTVFGLTVPVTLYCQSIGGAVVLSWTDPSFVLQAAPAVTGTYTNIPGATSPYTNNINGPQQYFRLLVSQ
jgi:uncharacterized repeat protein (TIGR03803 family)